MKKLVPSKSESVDYHFEWKICIPTEMREKVLVQEHDDALHLGADKTIARIKKRYYWPKLAEDVRSYIRKCTICKQSKPSNRSQHPEMGLQRITTKPFQIIALDFIQSLPRSRSGHAHLLVVMDLYSKFCLLFPVRKISASLVCQTLEQSWFRRYSTPEYIISDNASTFLSKEFKTFLGKYRVQHWTNPRHHSQSNPTERLNRTINSCIRTYVRTDQRLWDTRVSEIEYALNNSPHGATGFSPYKILFGHEIVGLGDEHRMDRDKEEVSEEERQHRKLEIDTFIHNLVYKNLRKQYDKNCKLYNTRTKTHAPSYSVGQPVLRRNFRLSSAAENFNAKFAPCFLPCTILSRVGTTSYELADESGKSLGVFSAADIKPHDT